MRTLPIPSLALLLSLTTALFFADQAFAQGGQDPWSRMSRFDEDGDGKVSRDEFGGPDRLFDRMDADKDGYVTKEEAGKMRRGGGGMGRGGRRGSGGQGGLEAMTKRMDADGNGTVSKAEWDAFFKKADENEDGILQAEELRAALTGRKFRDDAPEKGAAAPKVKAKSATDGRMVDLGAPQRTTVLVFGSWT